MQLVIDSVLHPFISKKVFRVYSHQESPLVHLLWSRPNTMLIFFLFGEIRFHTALFASEPETVNKTTRVFKVIHSLIHPFNRTRVHVEADRDHLFSWVSVQLFGAHPSVNAVLTPAQKSCTKGGNELEFDSIEPNKTGVNTPLRKYSISTDERLFPVRNWK